MIKFKNIGIILIGVLLLSACGDIRTTEDNTTIEHNTTGEDNSTIEHNTTGEDNTTIEHNTTGEDNSTIEHNPTGEENTTIEHNTTGEDNTTIEHNPTGEENTTIEHNPTGEDNTTIEHNPTGEDNTTIEHNTTGEDNSSTIVENSTLKFNAYKGITKFINIPENNGSFIFDTDIKNNIEELNSKLSTINAHMADITSVTQPEHGQVLIAGTNRSLSYVSEANFEGIDTFTYTIFGEELTVEMNVSKREGTTYYIDATSGNDEDNGTTPSSAWKTLSKLNATSFNPGDYILLKRGEVYHDIIRPKSSGDTNNPITIGSYGFGAKPIVTTMSEHNDLVWTDEGNNVWSTPLPQNPRRVEKDGKEILCAGYKMPQQLGKNLPDLAECYNDYDNKIFKMYSVDSPANHNIRYPSNYLGVYVLHTHDIVLENIEVIGGSGIGVYVLDGSNITLTNLTVGEYVQVGIEIRDFLKDDSTYAINKNIVIDGCTVDSKFTFDFSEAGRAKTGTETPMAAHEGMQIGGVDGAIIKNSLVKNFVHANLYLLGYATERGGEKVDGREVKNSKVFNNIFTSPDVAYGGRLGITGFAYNNELFNNLIIDTSVRSQFNGYKNHIHHNIFKGTMRSPLKGSATTGQGFSLQAYYTSVYDNVYDNNIIMDCEDEGIEISYNNGYGTIHDNTIKDNIFYNNGKLHNNLNIDIQPDNTNNTNDNNTIKNNFFYSDNSDKTIKFNNTVMDANEFNGNNGVRDYSIEGNLDNASENNNDTLIINLSKRSDVTNNSVNIEWELNKNATTQVEYGETTSYGKLSEKVEAKEYKQLLRNLKPNTTYHYRVVSEDNNGNKVVSDDRLFTTEYTSGFLLYPYNLGSGKGALTEQEEAEFANKLDVLKENGVNTIYIYLPKYYFHFQRDEKMKNVWYRDTLDYLPAYFNSIAKVIRSKNMGLNILHSIYSHMNASAMSRAYPELMLKGYSWKAGFEYDSFPFYVWHEKGGRVIEHNGKTYSLKKSHTSSDITEPGVGADWEEYWKIGYRNIPDPFNPEAQEKINIMLSELIDSMTVNGVKPDGIIMGNDEAYGWNSFVNCENSQDNACDERTTGQVFADMVNKGYAFVQKKYPGMDVYVWGDMFDKIQNGDPVRGNTADGLNYLNKNIIIADWKYSADKDKWYYGFDENEGIFRSVQAFYDAGFTVLSVGWHEEKANQYLVKTGKNAHIRNPNSNGKYVGHMVSEWYSDTFINIVEELKTPGTLQVDDNMSDADKLKTDRDIELVKSIKDVKTLLMRISR